MYSRLINFVYHSTLGLQVIKKRRGLAVTTAQIEVKTTTGIRNLRK